MTFMGPSMIRRCWNNGTITLNYSLTKNRYNIRWIKTYRSDTNVEDIKSESMYENVNIQLLVIYFWLILNLANNRYNRIKTDFKSYWLCT